jgi:hypothetical protein
MRQLLAIFASFVCLFGLADASLAESAGEQTPLPAGCLPYNVILRRDFNDFGWFNDCTTNQKVGAVASLTYDELAHRAAVSGDGVVALAYRPYYGNGTGFLGLLLAPFVQFDGTHLFGSLPTSGQNTDTVTVGGVAEFGFGKENGEASYFRLRGGEIYGSTGITSNTFVGEWLLVYPNVFHDFVPVGRFNIRLDPELMVQYDSLISGPKSYRLFSTNDYALRIGPQATILVTVFDPIWEPFTGFWNKTFLTLTYHAAVDTYAERNYYLALGTVTYNIIPNIGIALSYGYGNSETTGNNTSQIKLGLSGKF